MKKIAFCFTLMLLTGCKAQQPQQDQRAPITLTEWKLVKMYDEDLSAINPPVTLTLDENQKAHGYAGCNRFFGSYQSTDGSITFSGFGTTKMFCQDKMTVEDKYLKALGSIQSFKSDGANLYLLDDEKVILAFSK